MNSRSVVIPTARVTIDKSKEIIWDYMINLNNWWVKSNDEHDSLKVLSEGDELKEGTLIEIKEKVAGVSCVAIGKIHSLDKYNTVTWESDRAVYNFFGLRVKVREGVKWSLKKSNKRTILSADVFAEFQGFFGPLYKFLFKNVLNGIEKDYQHALKEVKYIKSVLDGRGLNEKAI